MQENFCALFNQAFSQWDRLLQRTIRKLPQDKRLMGMEIRMATARFCTGAASIRGWANDYPGRNDAVVNDQTNERGDGAATMDYLTG